VLKITASSADAKMVKVSLIGHYNVFFASWEKHGSRLKYSELRQLWQLAKALAPKLAIDPSEIQFPGSGDLKCKNYSEDSLRPETGVAQTEEHHPLFSAKSDYQQRLLNQS
jgi:hypothetical protein